MRIVYSEQSACLVKRCAKEHDAPLFARFCPICADAFSDMAIDGDSWNSDIKRRDAGWTTVFQTQISDSKFYLSEFNRSLLLISNSGNFSLWKNGPLDSNTQVLAPISFSIKQIGNIDSVVSLGDKVYLLAKGKLYSLQWRKILDKDIEPVHLKNLQKIEKIQKDSGSLYLSMKDKLLAVNSELDVTLIFDFGAKNEILRDFHVYHGHIYTISTHKGSSFNEENTIFIRCNSMPGDNNLTTPLMIQNVESCESDQFQIVGNTKFYAFRYNGTEAYQGRYSKLLTLQLDHWKFAQAVISGLKMLGSMFGITGASDLKLWKNAALTIDHQMLIDNLTLLNADTHLSFDEKSILYARYDHGSVIITIQDIETSARDDFKSIPGDLSGLYISDGRVYVIIRDGGHSSMMVNI